MHYRNGSYNGNISEIRIFQHIYKKTAEKNCAVVMAYCFANCSGITNIIYFLLTVIAMKSFPTGIKRLVTVAHTGSCSVSHKFLQLVNG